MMLTNHSFAPNQVLFMVLAIVFGAFMLYAAYAVYVAFKDEKERRDRNKHYYNGDELNSWMDMFFPKSSDN